jgi:hypothetical protein
LETIARNKQLMDSLGIGGPLRLVAPKVKRSHKKKASLRASLPASERRASTRAKKEVHYGDTNSQHASDVESDSDGAAGAAGGAARGT